MPLDPTAFGPAAADIAWQPVDLDERDASDSDLLAPGSDGLITGGTSEEILGEAYRRREAGASLDSIRRDLGGVDPFAVSNRVLENALDQGRRMAEFDTSRRISERRRYFSGWAPRWSTIAERDAYLASQAAQGHHAQAQAAPRAAAEGSP